MANQGVFKLFDQYTFTPLRGQINPNVTVFNSPHTIIASASPKAPVPDVIEFYSPKNQKYGFMSNFYPDPLVIDGVSWPTLEHYFQAMKFLGPDRTPASTQYAQIISMQPTPAKAMSMGKQSTRSKKGPDFNQMIKSFLDQGVRIRSDWEQVKDQVMMNGLRAKFSRPEMKMQLLATGSAQLVEVNPYDYYWAIGAKRTGQNKLGQLLMHLRHYLGGPMVEILPIQPKQFPSAEYNNQDRGCLRAFPPLPCPPTPFQGQFAFKEDWSAYNDPRCNPIPGARTLICDLTRDLHVLVIPNFLDNQTANQLWNHIIQNIPLNVESGTGFRGDYQHPRFIATMSDNCLLTKGLTGYGQCYAWDNILSQFRSLVQNKIQKGMDINTAQIDYYNSPEHKIIFHSARPREVAPPINMIVGLSLSPYYPRRMIFKERKKYATGANNKTRKWTFYPPNGSLYIMYGQTNEFLVHGSPQITKSEITKFGYDPMFMQRISVTFRQLHL